MKRTSNMFMATQAAKPSTHLQNHPFRTKLIMQLQTIHLPSIQSHRRDWIIFHDLTLYYNYSYNKIWGKGTRMNSWCFFFQIFLLDWILAKLINDFLLFVIGKHN